MSEMVSNRTQKWLRQALGLPSEHGPFPWQEELLKRFMSGSIDRSLDIPTGLGKTAVMAIWLVARAHRAALPRRLIYIVDRRAVVDQATEVAESLRDCVERNLDFKQSLGLGERSLPISTLRGRHVDNREWLEDPSSVAIIVGTVDMIGSQLLFEGYGTSRKMRPYHAGLLGVDTLMVIDEAHLVPAFEKLLEAVADGGSLFGPRDQEHREIVPSLKLLCLSATGRTQGNGAFDLQNADLIHPIVQKRLNAPKRLHLHSIVDPTTLPQTLAEQAWTLADKGRHTIRCIIFCDKRKDAEQVKSSIERLAIGDEKKGTLTVEVDTELFVGGRRIFERTEAAKRLKSLGFIAGSNFHPSRAAFLVATSAAEVGVDLDADHMVSDLVSWERMVQRLGRVNRRGEGDAKVIVVIEAASQDSIRAALKKSPGERSKKETEAVSLHEDAIKRKRAIKALLPQNGGFDASPGALRELKRRAMVDAELQALLEAATTVAPLRPALSRSLVDAWSMTSLKEHTGRPEIDPWLRGWVKDDRPQTVVIWRAHLPVRRVGRASSRSEIEGFFGAAPPQASEMLETYTFRVVEWLKARAKDVLNAPTGQFSTVECDLGEDAFKAQPILPQDIVACVLTSANDLRKLLTLEDILFGDDEKRINRRKEPDLHHNLAGATLVLDARIGGLKDGLLEAASRKLPATADAGDPWFSETECGNPKARTPVIPFRVRKVSEPAGQTPITNGNWQERLRFAVELSKEGEPTQWLIIDKWRHDSATEEDRAAGPPQLLDEHRFWTERRARELAVRLGLPPSYIEMLAIAASLHDEGKRARRWQRAFCADQDGVYAKTRGPLNTALLDGYRHEFGSLLFAEKDERLHALPDDLKDLALHLVVAHHGLARPITETCGCDYEPPSVLEDRAGEIALRFARLQKRWGPWGLAWWEALLRAADQQASRDNIQKDSEWKEEGN